MVLNEKQVAIRFRFFKFNSAFSSEEIAPKFQLCTDLKVERRKEFFCRNFMMEVKILPLLLAVFLAVANSQRFMSKYNEVILP